MLAGFPNIVSLSNRIGFPTRIVAEAEADTERFLRESHTHDAWGSKYCVVTGARRLEQLKDVFAGCPP